MVKDKIDYIKEFRNLFLAEHIKIKSKKGIETLKNVGVYWDPEKIYILDENDIMTFIHIDNFIEIKYKKEASKNLCAMIVHMTVQSYPELFSKRKYTDTEIG